MPIILLLLVLVLVSCGTDNDHFKIEGRFLNLNQGELRVYSLDGGTAKLDTIHINGGRFSAEIECSRPQTLMLVFPNFSEQPLFAAPGQSVDIKADASLFEILHHSAGGIKAEGTASGQHHGIYSAG